MNGIKRGNKMIEIPVAEQIKILDSIEYLTEMYKNTLNTIKNNTKDFFILQLIEAVHEEEKRIAGKTMRNLIEHFENNI